MLVLSWGLTFSLISETDMPSFVFAGIEPDKVIMTTEDISEDRTRADTPDSGGGGYFTLSESDSGSNLGTESPQHCIQRCNDIYRISKTYSNDNDTSNHKRNRSSDYNISRAADYYKTMTNEDIQGSPPVKAPPRPSRTSSLPPPIPNKSPEKKGYKRAGSLAHRNVIIPEQKPLEKILPLQIQSPSMLKTFQQTCSTEGLYISKTASRHHSQETHKMDNEKIFQKIPRGKSNAWETIYVESNGAKDIVEPKMFTNRN